MPIGGRMLASGPRDIQPRPLGPCSRDGFGSSFRSHLHDVVYAISRVDDARTFRPRPKQSCGTGSAAGVRIGRGLPPNDVGRRSTQQHVRSEATLKREIIRVEPLSTYLEKWKAPTSAVTRHGETIYVSGFPPFDPVTGEVVNAPIERQTELVLEQMKLCLETAGSSLEKVLKCNVYCTSVEKFASVNAIYSRYFPKDPPARIFVNVPAWPGHFDIEIDCIAAA
jgi:2-iminobutanoate/2-iminopropanoate deaminase